MNLGDVLHPVEVPQVEVAPLIHAGQEVGVGVGEPHVHNGPHEPLEEGTGVVPLVDESQDVAVATLQDVGQVVVVTGNDVAMVTGEFPGLVGDGSDFNLENTEHCEFWLLHSLFLLPPTLLLPAGPLIMAEASLAWMFTS